MISSSAVTSMACSPLAPLVSSISLAASSSSLGCRSFGSPLTWGGVRGVIRVCGESERGLRGYGVSERVRG